jgi:hypothetical protein
MRNLLTVILGLTLGLGMVRLWNTGEPSPDKDIPKAESKIDVIDSLGNSDLGVEGFVSDRDAE